MYNVHHLYADTELLSARLLIILSMARYSHRYLWTGPYVAPFILLLFFFKMLLTPLRPGKIKFCAKKFPNFLPGTLAFYRIVNISNDQQMSLINTLP